MCTDYNYVIKKTYIYRGLQKKTGQKNQYDRIKLLIVQRGNGVWSLCNMLFKGEKDAWSLRLKYHVTKMSLPIAESTSSKMQPLNQENCVKSQYNDG